MAPLSRPKGIVVFHYPVHFRRWIKQNKAATPLDNMLLTYSMSVLHAATILTQIIHGQQSLGLCTGVPLWRFDSTACANSTAAIPVMRSAQIEVCQIGTYGRIYETPIDEGLLRKRVPRKIDSAVAAWRSGARATNPHSDMYRAKTGEVFTQVNGPCLSLINQ